MVVIEEYPLKPDTEVVFLMDSSEGVTQEMYSKQKAFVKALARHFTVSPKGPYGSVLMYDQFAYIVSDFARSDLYDRIDSATLLGKPRQIDTALQQTAALLKRSKRTGRKIVILLTAGKQAPGADSLAEAIKPLRRLRAHTFVVAIGQEPDSNELKHVVDRPQDLFTVQQPTKLLSQSETIAQAIRDKPGSVLEKYFFVCSWLITWVVLDLRRTVLVV